MSAGRASLREVSTGTLESLRDAIRGGRLPTPLDRAGLVGFGIRHQTEAIERALAGHKRAACLAILEVALAEREAPRPTPELVWTGPEAPAGAARDTAVVLRSLFEGARESVILAGYSFDHGETVLASLHEAMAKRGVVTQCFVDVKQPKAGQSPGAHVDACLKTWMEQAWPFGDPRPRLFYDKRSLRPGPPWHSLHAKCVVVDGRKAFISSANFTERGQERNIEVGVLIDDPGFAAFLAGQWMGLVESGLVAEQSG